MAEHEKIMTFDAFLLGFTHDRKGLYDRCPLA